MDSSPIAPQGPDKRADRMDANSADADTIRGNTYRLLARLLAAPVSQDLLETLKRIDGKETGRANDGSAMARAWKTLKLASGRATIEAIDDEYHDLFIGIGRGELVPYGSWYLTGLLMDRPLALLRRDLAALGIERREDVHEPEDHAAALCETMSLLIDSGSEIPLEIQQRFFSDHIAPWMGRFFTDLQQAESARFYVAVGQLGEQFIEIEKRYLEMPV